MSQIETVKSKPILFSGPMVAALLNGSKTQTRRILKAAIEPQPWQIAHFKGDEWWPASKSGKCGIFEPGAVKCPHGVVGDCLWVRENWRLASWQWDDADQCFEYQADGAKQWRPLPAEDMDKWNNWLIRETDRVCGIPGAMWIDGYGMKSSSANDDNCRLDLSGCKVPWRPNIFLPRWASRITLEITSIKVERLNEISEEDAIAEGLARLTKDNGVTWKYGIPDRDGLPGSDDFGWHWSDWNADPRKAYRHLWEGINGKDSWTANPFVWAISFKRVEL